MPTLPTTITVPSVVAVVGVVSNFLVQEHIARCI